MPTTVSNPRDLIVQLLGELLHVERRLAGAVIRDVRREVRDEGLRAALEAHLEQTVEHVTRIERSFRLLGVAPTANLSRAFESAVAQHAELAATIVEPRLADLFHAQAALHVEHWELAAYRALLPLAPDEIVEWLQASYDEEGDAAVMIAETIDRLSDAR
jgi:ferritin-like metal-binding protein YciE